MFKSKEIRWFTRQENKSISKWFAGRGQTFESVSARTDHYLLAHGHGDVAPKLREGNIEIKHRTGVPQIKHLTPNAEGYFEEYVKWSFKLHEEDPESLQIIDFNKYSDEWLEVQKERMGVILAKEPDGTKKIREMKDLVDSGCQLEYTRIKVKEETWYSFNLEWFGTEFIEPGPALLHEIMGDSVFKLQDSMGYGSFLQSKK